MNMKFAIVFIILPIFGILCNSDGEEDQEISEEEEQEEPSFLVSNEDISSNKIEVLNGDKKNSVWLLVDDHYICHMKQKGEDGTQYFWECKQRRVSKCPYKISTRLTVGGPHEIEYMYSADRHTCYQDPVDALRQKFRSAIKTALSNDIHAKYGRVYAKEKIDLLNSITDPDFRERVCLRLPKESSLGSAANHARRVPTAPRNLDSINLDLVNNDNLNISEYLLGSSPSDGVYLFGTKKLAKEFANSMFKSVDATFKICPKLFYQVMLFLCIVAMLMYVLNYQISELGKTKKGNKSFHTIGEVLSRVLLWGTAQAWLRIVSSF